MFGPSQDTVEDSQNTVEATEAATPDTPSDLAHRNAETGVEAEEQPGEAGQPEDAEPEDQLEDQPEAAEPSEALPQEPSNDPKVAWESVEDEAGPAGGMGRLLSRGPARRV